MPSIYDCIFGPSLYRIFDENQSHNYVPFTVERYSDLAIRFISFVKHLATFASPYLVYCFYRHYILSSSESSSTSTDNNSPSPQSLFNIILNTTSFRLVAAMTVIYLASTITRGILRCRNPSYQTFLQAFRAASTLSSSPFKKDDDSSKALLQNRDRLRSTYDYEFSEWPIDFKWSDGAYANERIPKLLPLTGSGGQPQSDGPVVRAVSWLMAHTIGRLMLYPGSLSLVQKMLDNALVTGRQFLIENYHANRYKLEARDGNHIDCIFVDKRKSDKSADYKGNTLMICAEGNAGFYEIGIISSPLNNNYSVLGWNHPGFAGSTGSPYPQNEINAFDAVINFAVTELGFKLENICIFAWSIGGFTAAWASSQYPELKGLILDASFDDILPLARARMMPFLLPIVDSTIRLYFNLNVSAYLNTYKGPVLLIRRLQDEIIPLDPNDPVRTNRGNFILLNLLKARFPNLMQTPEVYEQVEKFLHTQDNTSLFRNVDPDECLTELISYISANGITTYPVNIDVSDISLERAKSIILFLAFKYMKNVNSTHCQPLPSTSFEEPFDLFALAK